MYATLPGKLEWFHCRESSSSKTCWGMFNDAWQRHILYSYPRVKCPTCVLKHIQQQCTSKIVSRLNHMVFFLSWLSNMVKPTCLASLTSIFLWSLKSNSKGTPKLGCKVIFNYVPTHYIQASRYNLHDQQSQTYVPLNGARIMRRS